MKRVKFTGDSSEVRDAKYSAKVLKRPPTTRKLAKLGSEDVVMRYQAVKLDATESGYHTLLWGSPIGANNVPMHIFNLSAIPNGGTAITSAAGVGMGWSSGLSTADIIRTNLGGLGADGMPIASAPWIPEVNGLVYWDKVTKAMHKWTSVKMQCYGSLKEDVKYTVSLVKFTDDFANLWNASTTNGQAKELLQAMTQSYLSSRINVSNLTAIKTYLKTLKEWSVVVPRRTEDVSLPGSYLSPSQRELNIFIRHNWMNDYNWPAPSTRTINNHDWVGSLGYGIDYEKHVQPMPGKCVFLIVRASCPYQVSFEEEVGNYNGTYNIVIRNCFTVPT